MSGFCCDFVVVMLMPRSVSELFIARWQLRYQVLENGRSRTDNVMPFVDIVEEVQQKVT